MQTQTPSYKTEAQAQKKAKGGTVPFKLNNEAEAEYLGVDLGLVGKWLLLDPVEAANAKEAGEVFTDAMQDISDQIEKADAMQEQAESAEGTIPVELPPELTEGGPPMNSLDANRAKSAIEKPVEVVHKHVQERLAADPNARRTDLQKELEAMGVNKWTARTQVQIALRKFRGQRATAAQKVG
jgi:hypothetical protein